MCKRIVFKCFLLFSLAAASSCSTLRFLGEPDTPVFYSGNDSLTNIEQNASLNVITFNIKKARKIDLAIAEIQEFEKTNGVDIFLLQEMDEKGVEAMAKKLHLHYLYFPVSYDKEDKKNIGNAILTSGKIDHPKKLILPHTKWMNKQRRAATIAEVTIHQKKIMVYSIHTETFGMGKKERMDQVDSIIEQARQQSVNYNYTIIGGDFNTAFAKDARLVVKKFTASGFNWSTDKVGATARALLGIVKPTNDYLFSKGLNLVNAFKIISSRSSDHYPVFATYTYQ